MEGGLAGWFGKYNLRCEPYDPSYKPMTMRVKYKKIIIKELNVNACLCRWYS